MRAVRPPGQKRDLQTKRLAPSGACGLDPELLEMAGVVARTIVDVPPLTVTLVGLAPGATLPAHAPVGPTVLHVLRGDIGFHAGSDSRELRAGDVLAMAMGVERALTSGGGACFLMTLTDPSGCEAGHSR